MALARIIAQDRKGIQTLSDALRARGFEVETRSSSQAPSEPVDFEITIEECSAEEAMQRATLEAGPRACVFITPGTIAGSPPRVVGMPLSPKAISEAIWVTDPGPAFESSLAENPSQAPRIAPVVEIPEEAATVPLQTLSVEVAAPDWADRHGTPLSDLASAGLPVEDVAMTFEPDSATAAAPPEAVLPGPGPHLVSAANSEAALQIEPSVLSRVELAADQPQPVSLCLNLELKVQTQLQKAKPQPTKIELPAVAEMLPEAAALSSAETVPLSSNAPFCVEPVPPQPIQPVAAPEVSPRESPAGTPFFWPHSRPETYETAHSKQSRRALEVAYPPPSRPVWFRRFFGKDPFFWAATTLAAGLAAVAALLLGFSPLRLPPVSDTVQGSGRHGQAPFAQGQPAGSKPSAVTTAASLHSRAVSAPRRRSVRTGDAGYVAKDIVIRYGNHSAGSSDKPAAQPDSNLIPAPPR